jgi:hypothetical protein
MQIESLNVLSSTDLDPQGFNKEDEVLRQVRKSQATKTAFKS